VFTQKQSKWFILVKLLLNTLTRVRVSLFYKLKSWASVTNRYTVLVATDHCDSSVNMVTELRAGRLVFEIFCRGMYLGHRTHTGSGTHPISYDIGTGVPSAGVKRPGRETYRWPASSAEVKDTWRYTSTIPYVFMAWYFVKHRDNFTFLYPFYQLSQLVLTGNPEDKLIKTMFNASLETDCLIRTHHQINIHLQWSWIIL
jgi:hypothetical protein